MPDFRVKLSADFIVTKRKDAISARETIINLLKENGFEDKNFELSIDKIDKGEEKTQKVEIVKIPIVKPINKEEKKITVKRKLTRVRKNKKGGSK